MRILDGFQYADSHPGEGCPANWEKGKATIKANADGSKDFFAVSKFLKKMVSSEVLCLKPFYLFFAQAMANKYGKN